MFSVRFPLLLSWRASGCMRFLFGFLFVLLFGCNIVGVVLLLSEVASLFLVILVPSRALFISSQSNGRSEKEYHRRRTIIKETPPTDR